MSRRNLLLGGCIAILVAAAIGLAVWSFGWFAVSSLGLGVVIELVVAVGIFNDAPSRKPDEILVQMQANQYGQANIPVKLPTDAASWRPMLIGLPALVVGAVSLVVYLLVAGG